MFKSIILLALAASVLAEHPLQSANYDTLKHFIQGLMDGYYDTNYDLPDACLDIAAQSKLDEDIIAILGSITSGKWSSVEEYLGILSSDLSTDLTQCDFGVLKQTLSEVYAQRGLFRIILDFLMHSYDIIPDFIAAITDLFALSAYKSGHDFGLVLRDIFVPVAPSALLGNYGVDFDAFSFTNGFLLGLQRNPDVKTECFNDMFGALSNFQTVFSDANQILEIGGIQSYSHLFTDLSILLKSVKTFGEPCNFAKLESTIRSYLTAGGSEKLITNYVLNIRTINECYENFKMSVNEDWFSAGKDIGVVFSKLTAWSI